MMPPTKTQDLARRILSYEAVEGKTSASTRSASVRAWEKLRESLCTLAGVAGYRSLLSRALTLAQADAPWLSAVQVMADGSLQGLDAPGSRIDDDLVREGEVILLCQLLGLVLTFIGADLTVRLLRDVWPDAVFEDIDSRSQRK
jgi:hypothetical protein